MSQTNTNTNNGQNQNQNSRRSGQGQGPSGSGGGNCHIGCGNNLIANKYAFKGKMKDGPISKLLITKIGHRPTQYKKIGDTFSILCKDKNFQGLNEVIWTRNNLVETGFMPIYPNTNRWSITQHVQVNTGNLMDVPISNGSRSACFEIVEQSHVFDTNLQKDILSEYRQNSKNKSQDYTKFLTNKKAFNHNHIWTM